MKKIPAMILMLVVLNASADPTAERGWYFYQDPSIAESTPTTQANSNPQYPNYSAYNEAIKREFEEVQDRAIYNPTPENVTAYNQALRAISNNAVRFGMLSVTQNWQDPNSGLNTSAANGAGLVADLDTQRKQIAQLINRYALFYFIGKDCRYCNIEANEIKRLELTYNITVRVISLDGSILPQYPQPTLDKGISQKLGIQKAGQLVAFDSQTNKTTTIGFGYMHFDQIIQHLQTLFISGTADWHNYMHQATPVKLVGDEQ